jgi:sterol desaturase/sphingolipid hydroxylase (fatty acid hydroxylase superfamily)
MNPLTCEISWTCAAQVAVFQLFMNSVRYFPLAGGALLVLWFWKRGAVFRFRIQQRYPEAARIWFEFRRSFATLFVFTALATFSLMSSKLGLTRLYLDIDRYGIPYLFLSLALLTVWHETFFYWAHRFMHRKPFFKWIHLTHHRSTNPSPMAAYSFSLPEAFLEAVYLTIFVFLVPIHPFVILGHAFYAMVMNIWWHSGVEIFPAGWTTGRLSKWINTSTHHNMHHSHFNGNYSLYFNFWDRVCGTNFPQYDTYFEAVVARRATAAPTAEKVHGGTFSPT